jgi:hypothetical protein
MNQHFPLHDHLKFTQIRISGLKKYISGSPGPWFALINRRQGKSLISCNFEMSSHSFWKVQQIFLNSAATKAGATFRCRLK